MIGFANWIWNNFFSKNKKLYILVYINTYNGDKMNVVEFGNFLQNLIDEDVIKEVDTRVEHRFLKKENILAINFKEGLKIAVVDSDGNMIPFVSDCIEYSSMGIIEFLEDENLYLSRAIDEIEKIHWKMNVRIEEN